MQDVKPLLLPIGAHTKLTNFSNATTLKDPKVYGRLVGKLIYLTITRPDITYVVQLLSQFMQAPAEEHLQAAKHVMRYLESCLG